MGFYEDDSQQQKLKLHPQARPPHCLLGALLQLWRWQGRQTPPSLSCAEGKPRCRSWKEPASGTQHPVRGMDRTRTVVLSPGTGTCPGASEAQVATVRLWGQEPSPAGTLMRWLGCD